MTSMRYQQPNSVSKARFETIVSKGNPGEISDALIGTVLAGEDLNWALDQCRRLSSHSDRDVRGAVASSIGHLARIHGRIDLRLAEEILRDLERDTLLGGKVEDARDDIAMFMASKGE